MTSYKLWNKKDSINGVNANHFLNKEPFKSCDGDIILIYNGEKVSNVECKDILATIYGIDVNLPLDEFIKLYIEKTSAPIEEVQE